METIDNAVFGKLTYDFQWEKKDSVVLWGVECPITTVVEALPGESITKVQEENYKMIQAKKDLLESEELNKTLAYLNKSYAKTFSTSADILAYTKLQSILYKQNGKVVMLFSIPDDELGMGIEIKPSYSVGVQDLYL